MFLWLKKKWKKGDYLLLQNKECPQLSNDFWKGLLRSRFVESLVSCGGPQLWVLGLQEHWYYCRLHGNRASQFAKMTPLLWANTACFQCRWQMLQAEVNNNCSHISSWPVLQKKVNKAVDRRELRALPGLRHDGLCWIILTWRYLGGGWSLMHLCLQAHWHNPGFLLEVFGQLLITLCHSNILFELMRSVIPAPPSPSSFFPRMLQPTIFVDQGSELYF